ncbi:O-methyltransferase [Virgisporangium aliadipatigenens]|nr:class I SAM-dependent methyltransferase [Virgisporangium aliadipatigenens]
MTITLHQPPVRDLLDRLFDAAARDAEVPVGPYAGGSFEASSAGERADALESVYMPISARGGELLYSLVRATRPQTVVEFGTSYGISTLYLAAAVRDNGAGRVYSTELSATKIAHARANLAAAGLDAWVDIVAGDARETLRDVPGPIGLVLLDGWKDLYLTVLCLLEPRLAPGALVIGDDIEMAATAQYLAYVRDPANGYVSTAFPVEDGMEISCRAANQDTLSV